MNDLSEFVMLSGWELVTDSRRVAKHFGRHHKNILRGIENLGCSAEFRRLNFELCFEINNLANGKRDKLYRMSKDGFLLLAMGFTGEKAMRIKEAYIGAFNQMAGQLRELGATLWEQRLALEKREATSAAWASFGSRCLLDRKRAIRDLENERHILQDRMQPALPFAMGVLQ